MSSVTQCPTSAELFLLSTGTLSRQRADQIAAHVERCDRCQRALRKTQQPTVTGLAAAANGETDLTWSSVGESTESPVSPDPEERASRLTMPATIGRYRIERPLGQGGFGVVYLGHDPQLQRPVAIKIPLADLINNARRVELYLEEARIVASLDHPHIVPIYDVGQADGFPCYVVSKYIAGTDLATRIMDSRLPLVEAVRLVATITDALHYAHKQGLVHRDIKPANILLDERGTPFLVDFGLALRDRDLGKGPRCAGTPAYMSPEQARGEGHRVDGRSDIFSLGAVLYELLVGRRAFRGETDSEVLAHVTRHEPRPLRQYDDSIPKELERICQKALAKRAADRYSTAKDLADDLRYLVATMSEAGGATPHGISTSAAATASPQWSAGPSLARTPNHESALRPAAPSTPQTVTAVVPKGLRSFDSHDSDFFLELIPGPRDRGGLPGVLRFWKTRIDQTEQDETFSVGLIYGPSGCGKSSLVKAGLLPRLGEHVMTVYVEATPYDTEARLLQSLRKHLPVSANATDLTATLAALRQTEGAPSGQKVLIVLDQFEQWLHANPDEPSAELVLALRQCDGARVQCVVMVRDDFWMAATRFMRNLEVRLVEGENSAAVDLFPIRHAIHVLGAFGRAFGELPAAPQELNREQEDFLKQAVEGLAADGKVICVRLALFAEMMKGKSWKPATLKQVGGTTGIGIAFLEDTFSAHTAPPEHRYYQSAARAVLRCLLPQGDADLKGRMRSEEELLTVSGYERQPADFRNLIRILDREVRLITPTESATTESAASPAAAKPLLAGRSSASPPPRPDAETSGAVRQYQLTHDYLVQPLREWLTRKQLETRRGRAELVLAERAAIWSVKPETRHLPAWWEYLSIRLFAPRRGWSQVQSAMMRRATKVYGLRVTLAVLLLAALGWAGYESNGRLKADALVRALSSAETQDVPTLVDALLPYRRWANPRLQRTIDTSPHDKERLHARLALAVDDPRQLDALVEALAQADAEDVPVIVQFLLPSRRELTDRFWTTIEAPSRAGQRLRWATALAGFNPDDERWQKISRDVAVELTSLLPVTAESWIKNLRPARRWLLPHLADTFRERDRTGSERAIAAAALADYLGDRPGEIAELILLADTDDQYAPLRAPLAQHPAQLTAGFVSVLDEPVPDAEEDQRNLHWKRQANAAACLIDLQRANERVWGVLRHSLNPSLRSYVIRRLRQLKIDILPLIERLRIEPDTSTRRALILALGQFDESAVPLDRRNQLFEELGATYRRDPDPGIHSALASTLQRWNQSSLVASLDRELTETAEQFERRFAVDRRAWFHNRQGQLFLVLPDPVELIRPDKRKPDQLAREPIPYGLAIAAREVTVEQFLRFLPKHAYETEYAPLPECPANLVTWYEAAAYCNWLNEQENIPREEWCYAPNEAGNYADGMSIVARWYEKTGYRLPTDAEAEYCNRAGSVVRFGFGDPLELLDDYDWYVLNSQFRSWPVGRKLPNDLGAFDVHGNNWEWCQNTQVIAGNFTAAPETVLDQPSRIVRNGVFFRLATSVASHERSEISPSARSNNVSLRPVRRVNRPADR